MPDVFKVADVLVSHVVKTHGEEIDIIGYYGSYAQGHPRDDSDLDIFYVPADGKNPPVGRTFLLGGVLFDFWPITWDMMEGFATGHIRGWAFAPALVHHAKILHARSEEQAGRLTALKQRILDLQKPEARPQMIRRALKAFTIVMTGVGNVRLAATGGDFADIRYAGWQVILSVVECLALANQTFFDRDLRSGVDQLSDLQDKPVDMQELIVSISTSPDASAVVAACERLAIGTRQVLRRLQESLPSQTTIQGRFHQAYPEIKDMIGKLLSACQRREKVAASAATWLLQSDLSDMLNDTQHSARHSDFNLYREFASVYRQLDFPDLMLLSSGETCELANQAELLDDRLRQWLREQTVSLQEFENLEELERSLPCR